jgi:hypothetical protein
MAIIHDRLILAQHGVKRVAGLVNHRLQVALQAGSVHENERLAHAVAILLISARRLALARIEIEAIAAAQRVKEVRQLRIDLAEKAR